MKQNILILGHSFTRRLQTWCMRNHHPNLNLLTDRFQIYWHGIGGATIMPHLRKSLWSEISLVSDLDISAVFLDLGTNDLGSSNVTSEQLVERLINFSAELIARGCKVVLFSEILHRKNDTHFNNKVDRANALLKLRCSNNPHLIFWSHCRNNFNRRFTKDYISADGVHVDNDRGMPRYYTSVRGACIFAERFL